MGSTAEMVFGLCLVHLGWLGHRHRSGCRCTCKHVHQHVPTWVTLSARASLPGGVPSSKLQEQRSPVCTDQDSPVPPGLAAAALPKQAGSRPAVFGDSVRQSYRHVSGQRSSFSSQPRGLHWGCSAPAVTTGKSRFTDPGGSFPASSPAPGRGFGQPS